MPKNVVWGPHAGFIYTNIYMYIHVYIYSVNPSIYMLGVRGNRVE